MAMANFNDWVPEEWTGPVVTKIQRQSAVQAVGRHEKMKSDTTHVPRSGGVSVSNTGKGDAYDEDAHINDDVVLTARKLTGGVSIAEEDLSDIESYVDVVDSKKLDWATSFAKAYDNASLGVTAAESDTASNDRPFTSIYKLVRTTDATLDPDYTADDNYANHTFGATAVGADYDALNGFLSTYEEGDYFDETDTVVIASPAFKRLLRGIKDGDGMPVFVQGQTGDSGTPDTLFGYEIRWSQGARTSAAMTDAPTGNPLMIVGNRRLLIIGDRWAPESLVIPPAISKVDEAFLKLRYRGGFAGGHPTAFSVLEAA